MTTDPGIVAALIGLAGVGATLSVTIWWSVVSRQRDVRAAQVLKLERALNRTWMATVDPGRRVTLDLWRPNMVAAQHLEVSLELYETVALLAVRPWRRRIWARRRANFVQTLAEMQIHFHDAAIAWLADPRDFSARLHFFETVKAATMSITRWRTDPGWYWRTARTTELMRDVPPRPTAPSSGWRRLVPHETLPFPPERE